jgi:ketosteroid isomerase-like protein
MSDREYQQALKDFYSAIEKAQSARDVEGALATMAEDVVLLAPDAPAFVGKTAVRGYYQNAFAAFAVEGSHKPEWTEIRGDVVIQWGHYSGSVKPIAGGNAIPLKSKFLFVFRRQPSGKLLAWRASMNYEAPFVMPAPAK